jgi:hypothetical protein
MNTRFRSRDYVCIYIKAEISRRTQSCEHPDQVLGSVKMYTLLIHAVLSLSKSSTWQLPESTYRLLNTHTLANVHFKTSAALKMYTASAHSRKTHRYTHMQQKHGGTHACVHSCVCLTHTHTHTHTHAHAHTHTHTHTHFTTTHIQSPACRWLIYSEVHFRFSSSLNHHTIVIRFMI